MPPLDDMDRTILNRIQSDFPIASRPFQVIAHDLDLTEADVIDRIARLKQSGIIRRIGGNFVPDKLGYVSTLCAARVPEARVGHFTEIVNAYPGVTHNYLRQGRFNIWFTFIASSMAEIRTNLNAISQKSGIRDIINLPATRVFKIKAHFDL